MPRLLIFVLLLQLSGCIVFPIHKTLQPEAIITVTDASGMPVVGASVSLISSSYPYGLEKTRLSRMTDQQGQAAFEALRQWRVEALVIHGAEIFFWNWCVAKAGFETHLTSWRNGGNFESAYQLSLVDGISKPCPVREY